MIRPFKWQMPIVKAEVEALSEDGVFINAACTGAGKTVMALAAVKEMGRPALVIAPKVSLTQWRRTAEDMGAGGLIVDCVSPQLISRGSGVYYRGASRRSRGGKKVNLPGEWFIPEGCVVIWDEPHKSASGEDSAATMAMARLKSYGGVSLLAMSATVADSPLKLRALGYWMGFHRFIKSDFHRWCAAHGCFTMDFGNGRAGFVFTRGRSAEKYMAQIRRDMGRRFLSISPSEIEGFPEQTLDVVRVDLNRDERKELDDAYAEMPENLKRPARSELAAILKGQQRAEFSKARVMALLAESAVDDGRSAVLFFNFTDPRQRAEKYLAEAGYGFVSVYGGQKDGERQEAVDRFQRNEVHVCLVMTKAGGAALNLHDERKERARESFLAPSFDASDVKQALGRIRRCNGTSVAQHLVLAADTIEEKVAASLDRKLANIDALNTGETALEDDDFRPW